MDIKTEMEGKLVRVEATNEQLEMIGISHMPSRVGIATDIDKYSGIHAPNSKVTVPHELDFLAKSGVCHEYLIPTKWLVIEEEQPPKEITRDCESGLEYASYRYYDGINLAKSKGWVQVTSMRELDRDGTFMICCGDVMIKVDSSKFPYIKRTPI